jgi:hypothetical protein
LRSTVRDERGVNQPCSGCGLSVVFGADGRRMSINCFAPIPFHAFRIPGMQIVASWYRHLDAKAIRKERNAA